MLKGKRIGVALTGSFCTFETVLECIEHLVKKDAKITPIMSYNAYTQDTKFGKAAYWVAEIEAMTGQKIIHTIPDAEPIGPSKLLDILAILPATGNTIAKIAQGIADTPATFAAKSQLRNGRPVIIGISSNDALAAGAKNIGYLLNTKNIYFIPFGQDDCIKKPYSILFNKEYVLPAINGALEGKQIQPLLV